MPTLAKHYNSKMGQKKISSGGRGGGGGGGGGKGGKENFFFHLFFLSCFLAFACMYVENDLNHVFKHIKLRVARDLFRKSGSQPESLWNI